MRAHQIGRWLSNTSILTMFHGLWAVSADQINVGLFTIKEIHYLETSLNVSQLQFLKYMTLPT